MSLTASPVSAPPVRSSAPAQLPPGLALFIGRRDELAELDRMLEEGLNQQHGAAVLALDGMLGVGKTTLAAYWAHRVAGRFTDGQLFLNLREFGDGEPMSTAEALAQLLSGLGMPYAELPPTVEARAAQFRTLTAERKLLILLDDVRDADQVRPLIPASPGSLVLVTSRGRLTGLATADGALLLGLDVPPAADAREMLLARLTLPSPAGREDDATLDTVLDRAGRLPLALAIIATRMSEYAPRPLRDLAGCMAEKDGLDGFVGDDADSDMRAVLERSYRRLSPEAGRLFRRLSAADAEVEPAVAAELAATTRSSVTTLLSELVRAGLLARTGFSRYAMHPLVRAYAAELAAQTVKQRRLRLVHNATGDDLGYAGMATG